MAKLQDAILRDTLANRPAAGKAGRLFYDTTNGQLQRDNGSSWDSVGETGAALTVQDEGASLATAAGTLNFTGAGVTASGTGAVKTINVPGGGGVASPFWWHSDNAPASPDAANREFTEGTTVGTLTRASDATPRGTWTETRNGLEWDQTSVGTTGLDIYLIPRTVSVGDYVTVAAAYPDWLASGVGLFVGFANGTAYGSSMAVGTFAHHTVSSYRSMLNRWPNFNARDTDGTIYDNLVTDVYGWRVKYEAANTWGLYVRGKGGGWRPIQTNLAVAMTPTHVAFGVAMFGALAATAGNRVRLECFRVND